MTYGVGTPCDSATYDEHPARNALPQTLFGGIALAVIASACGRYAQANHAGCNCRDLGDPAG